jgi:hypothetical protein
MLMTAVYAAAITFAISGPSIRGHLAKERRFATRSINRPPRC